MSCRFQDRPCTVFFAVVHIVNNLMQMLKEDKRKRLRFKPEPFQ